MLRFVFFPTNFKKNLAKVFDNPYFLPTQYLKIFDNANTCLGQASDTIGYVFKVRVGQRLG